MQVFENSKIDVNKFGLVEIGENETQNEVCRGDIFFTTSSETPEDVGTASVLLDNVEHTYLNSFCFGFRPKQNCLFPEFARYALREIGFRKEVVRLSQGSTRYNLSKIFLMGIRINLPSIDEQQKIASFLSAVDEKIDQLSQKKELLVQFKKSMMQKLFSQEIRFKDEQGKDYPSWTRKKLGNIAKVIGGGTPSTKDSRFWNGAINWFTPTEIDFKYCTKSIRRISKLGLESSSASRLPVGAILFSSTATIGKVSIATEECTTNQQFQSFVVSPLSYSNEYLYYWIKQNLIEFLRKANGSTFLLIPKSEIKKIPVDVLILAEQQKIASFLSAIDQKIELTSRQIELTQQFKKGLLQQMFV